MRYTNLRLLYFTLEVYGEPYTHECELIGERIPTGHTSSFVFCRWMPKDKGCAGLRYAAAAATGLRYGRQLKASIHENAMNW